MNTGERSEEPSETQSELVEPGDPEAELDPNAELALIGARHDLQLSEGTTTPVCSCLAVAAGGPENPKFTWLGVRPAIDPSRQLVIALSSQGIECPAAPADSLGASYWGHRMEGGDVIVVVESAKLGRPITQGAVIPLPATGGRVVVRPASKTTPYGHPLNSTQKDCVISG